MSYMSVEKLTKPVEGGVHAPMTVNGVLVRTAILLLVSLAAGVGGWFLLPQGMGLLAILVGVGGAILFSVLANRRPLQAKLPAFGYAVLQGFLVGSVSRWIPENYGKSASGIVQGALVLTMVIVATTLFLYATRIVKVTNKFRAVVFFATMSVFVYYVLAFLLGLAGVQMPLIYDTGTFGMLFTLVVLIIASMNLFTDYWVVENAVEQGADERFEWFAAFGITATVLWIYVEALRLLSKR